MRDAVIAGIAIAVLAALPFVVHSPALLDFVVRASSMTLFATSLNLLVGSTGLVSFGHGLFYGFGAYAFGLLMQQTALPLWAAMGLAVVMAAAVALIVGAICLRLRTIYFAFVTLAMQMLFYSIIISWQDFTGGDQGLRGGIPRRIFLGYDLNQPYHLYLFCAVTMVLGLLAMRHITASPFGATLRMIRDNERRAGFLGITLWRAKLTVFVLAAMFAALGGVLASLFVSGAYPELADWPISGQAIFAIMLGGIGTFLGPLVGTVLLLELNDVTTGLTEYHNLVLGVVILVFALGLRRGIVDFVLGWRRPLMRRATP